MSGQVEQVSKHTSTYIELCPIQDVTPYDKNPRKNEAAVAAVMQGQKTFNRRNSLMWNDNKTVSHGHGSLTADIRCDLTTVSTGGVI